jgi:hypothetical protein
LHTKTMHAVQRLERAHLKIAAVTQAVRGVNYADPGPPERIFEDAKMWIDSLPGAQKTMGSAFERVYGSNKNPDFRSTLKDTRSRRDALAHRFLVDSDLRTDRGRRIALGQLAEMDERFHKTLSRAT